MQSSTSVHVHAVGKTRTNCGILVIIGSVWNGAKCCLITHIQRCQLLSTKKGEKTTGIIREWKCKKKNPLVEEKSRARSSGRYIATVRRNPPGMWAIKRTPGVLLRSRRAHGISMWTAGCTSPNQTVGDLHLPFSHKSPDTRARTRMVLRDLSA